MFFKFLTDNRNTKERRIQEIYETARRKKEMLRQQLREIRFYNNQNITN